MMPTIRLGAIDFVPLQFALLLQLFHEREVSATVTAQKDTMELLIRELKELRAENASLRRYCGDAGGSNEVIGL